MTKHQNLENRLIDFAVQVIDIVEALPTTRAGNHAAALQESNELIAIFVSSLRTAENSDS